MHYMLVETIINNFFTRVSARARGRFLRRLELFEGKTLEWPTPLLKSEDIKQLKSIIDDIRKISRKGRNCITARIPLNPDLSRPFQKEVRKRQTKPDHWGNSDAYHPLPVCVSSDDRLWRIHFGSRKDPIIGRKAWCPWCGKGDRGAYPAGKWKPDSAHNS